MIQFPGLCSLTATEVLRLIKDGTITVEQYIRVLLDRIDNRDGIVKAWAYLGTYSSQVCDVCGAMILRFRQTVSMS
jgi:Asp-tRNA(Asn)/Glu-tRNA(Gln) amidotransferase A subunit family amidase